MEYRRLGKSGLKVSALSLGSWVTYGGQVGEEAALSCMSVAYDAGINFFDNAEAYAHGNAEKVVGQVLRKKAWRRESLVLSTKIFWGAEHQGPNDKGLSFKHVIEGVNAALERLGTRYVDLCYCHRPDPETPVEETVRAMDVLIRQGKIFYWGTSEWSANEIHAAFAAAREWHLTPPTMEQPQYNLFHRERVEKEYAPLYVEHGLGTTIWSPLASGVLSGKYVGGIPAGSRLSLDNYAWLKKVALSEERNAVVKKLQPIAQSLGCTLAQLAIAWCLKNPRVSSVILGATKPEQVTENLIALEVEKKIDAAVLSKIEAALQP
jgi:voltage-dependent potassium channel beta subunit